MIALGHMSHSRRVSFKNKRSLLKPGNRIKAAINSALGEGPTQALSIPLPAAFFCFLPPSSPTQRFHPDPACLYLSCKRYWQTSLKMDRTKGNIPEIVRTWNPQWNVEGQNRTATWETSARGFSSWGLSVCSKRYKMLRNHLHHPVCSLCY